MSHDAGLQPFQLLEEVCMMGKDKKYVSQKPQPKSEQLLLNIRSPQPHAGASSDEEEDEEDIANGTQESAETQESEQKQSQTEAAQ